MDYVGKVPFEDSTRFACVLKLLIYCFLFPATDLSSSDSVLLWPWAVFLQAVGAGRLLGQAVHLERARGAGPAGQRDRYGSSSLLPTPGRGLLCSVWCVRLGEALLLFLQIHEAEVSLMASYLLELW